MQKRKARLPKIDPNTTKRVATPSTLNKDYEPGDAPLSWRFQHVDHDGPWNFDDIPGEVMRDILRKMRDWESIPVKQIRCTGQLFKEYDVGGIITKAIARLRDMRLDDATAIHRFRLTGEQRLYGFLGEGNVFHVVWWDPKHEICPSRKKNT